MWNFRERNKSSSSRWLFGEPPAAFSELQLDYTILELQCTSITTSCRQLSCKGLWPAQCRELQRQEPAHQEGWVASISGCAMVVRFIVCFPRPRSSGKTAAILRLSTRRRCVKSLQSLSWRGMSLVRQKHVVLLGKCWFSSQRGFGAHQVDSF